MDMTQADSVVYTSETESTDKTNSPSKFSNSTYSIISKVAYLIGVPVKIFENEHEPPKMEQYEELSKNKNARIIRNLCMLRTAIELNFSKLNKEIYYNLKNLACFRHKRRPKNPRCSYRIQDSEFPNRCFPYKESTCYHTAAQGFANQSQHRFSKPYQNYQQKIPK